MKISVVIHTYNSERFLRRVLESVREFDEIVVCDMHSTDKTLEIAKEYNCKIVFFEKCTHAEPARNFAIQSATYEWVLVVDSDEVVPDALREYLYNLIQEPDCPKGLWIPHKNYFMGRFMHGDYPGHILRFFWKEGSDWPPYVHSVVKVDGRVEKIPAKRKDLAFIHLANNTIENKIRKINTYSDNDAIKRANQSFPYFKMIYAPAFRFIKAYFFKGGFLDGKAGLTNACMNAIYKFTTIAKVWENQIKPEDIDPELKD